MKRLYIPATASVAAIVCGLAKPEMASADGWRIPIPSANGPNVLAQSRGLIWVEAEGGYRWRPQPTFTYGSILGANQPAYSVACAGEAPRWEQPK